MPRTLCPIALAALSLAAPALAQTGYFPRPDVYVNDSNNDKILRLRDLNGDGDYADAGESSVFYDDTLGGYALTNNIGIVSLRDGTVFVNDSSNDYVLRLRDLDGDGNCHGVNEANLYFESINNAANIPMLSAAGMDEHNGILWVAVAQSGSSGKDYILRLEDLNADGDAADLNEALEYYVSSNLGAGGSASDSLPQDVRVGRDGNVYYLEQSSNGAWAKGIYRLVDADNNGIITAGESIPFFTPPVQATTAFHWGMDQDESGAWYIADTSNELIWRARDTNGNGLVEAGEYQMWWQSPGASLIWNVRCGTDGALYAGETQNNERLLRMVDANNNGQIDVPSEVTTLYDELTTLGTVIGQQRGFNLDGRWLKPSVAYCTAQQNALGCSASMSSLGTPSATHGSGFFIRAAPMRNQKQGLLFYGTTGRDSTPFLGGTMCVQAPLRRTPVLGTGGSASGDDCTGVLSVDFNAYIATGVNTALVAGVTLNTQFWSRDPGAPNNTNLTGGLEFTLGN
jgi:hypothetical protein